MKDIKVYNITFDEDELESGIDQIAILEDPAIEVFSMRFSENKNSYEKLCFDNEKQVVAGPILIPEKLIYRKDKENGEYYVKFTAETIEKLVEKFNKELRETRFNFEHDPKKPVNGFIKGLWIIEDPKKDKSAYYGFNDLPTGTAFVEAKIEDKEQWEYIKGLNQVGFSIEGLLGIDLVNLQINNKKNITMKDTKNKKKFLATREVTKRTFNKKTKKFQDEVVTEQDEVIIVEELEEGKKVEILNDDAEITVAPDGEYVIPAEEVAVEVVDGVIASVEEIEVTEEMEEEEKEEEMEEEEKEEKEEEMEEEEKEEEKEEEMEEEDNMVAKIAEIEARIDSLESKLSDVDEESPNKFKNLENTMSIGERLNILKSVLK